MEIRDWFILILTFLVGLVTGVYFYATVFAPSYEDKDVFAEVDEVPDVAFDVIGLQYGGFRVQDYIQPSFRLSAEGTYKYTKGGTEESLAENGVLPEVLAREVAAVLDEADLAEMSVPVSDKSCVSYADGIEFAYSVEMEEEIYELDTCTTAFENNTDLGVVLAKVWRYMDDPDVRSISISNTTEGATNVTEEVEEKSVGNKWFRMLNPVKYFEDGFEESFGE